MSTPPNGPIPVPMFALSGWTTSLQQKADALISHFFESDSLQSSLYKGKITNLQYIIEQYGHDINGLTMYMRSALETYFNRYYDSSLINVTYDTGDPQNPTNPSNAVTLRLAIEVTEGGVTYPFGRLIDVEGNAIKRIIALNNVG